MVDWLDALLASLGLSTVGTPFGALLGLGNELGQATGLAPDQTDTSWRSSAADLKDARSKKLALGLGLAAGAVAAPAIYAAYLSSGKRRKKGLTDKEIRTGIALENNAMLTQDLIKTAIASPALMVPTAYLLVELLENYPIKVRHPDGSYTLQRGLISGHLGDDIQGLMTLGAAAPLIASLTGLATSAFAKGKK